MAATTSETKYYHHGRFAVAGGIIPDAITAYRTYGDPKNPCVVFPTCFGAKLDVQVYLVGPGRILDTDKYFVVTFALFSNGESSSPSNTPAPYNGPNFPAVTYEDNIRAQYAVVTKELGVKKLFCAIGFSMGGQQAYFWAVMYPDFVERLVSICGSARTSPHNHCFLEGPIAALTNSVDFKDGHYDKNPERGVRAFGRVYSSWPHSQAWFRRKAYLRGGHYTDLISWLRAEWEARFWPSWDANDILYLARTWQMADVSRLYAHSVIDPILHTEEMKTQETFGDLAATLARVKAKALIMPNQTDLYFPPEDSQAEVEAMKGNNAILAVIPTDSGHMAGAFESPEDIQFLTEKITDFFRKCLIAKLGTITMVGSPWLVAPFQTLLLLTACTETPGIPVSSFRRAMVEDLTARHTWWGPGRSVTDAQYRENSNKQATRLIEQIFDPARYFVVTFALFSNGESSSPSNTPSPHNGPYFPFVAYEDNIRAQYTVLTKKLGISKVYCVAGFSMGGQQSYYWAVMYPDFVERLICICGSARTSPHNYCFLEGPIAALTNSVDFYDGHYTKNAERGLRAFARVYSAWPYGQAWFRRKAYLRNGQYSNMNSWLLEEWEGDFYPAWDANDILCLARTWQMGDVSKLYAHSTMDISLRTEDMKPQETFGDLAATLSRVKAKALVMPNVTDLYFPPEDSAFEVQAMKDNGAILAVIPTDSGHVGGGFESEEDKKFITEQIETFFKNT
ncbi:Alpha/Beta hydrolase protein [Cristinia sonorae]|uniref:Alpha/Beta hydrolase protein n=1 Tax=Cristinia sonorae TaxID=1940300 RepID=A0A8K0V0I3_9AGAR|nr:Alpha/Beta hydrolase protein [Cristinia sonorae]